MRFQLLTLSPKIRIHGAASVIRLAPDFWGEGAGAVVDLNHTAQKERKGMGELTRLPSF